MEKLTLLMGGPQHATRVEIPAGAEIYEHDDGSVYRLTDQKVGGMRVMQWEEPDVDG